DPPVDVARIVALRVAARLGVLHATPADRRRSRPAAAMATAPRRPPTGRGLAQGDQFGQGGVEAGKAGTGDQGPGTGGSRSNGRAPGAALPGPRAQVPGPHLHGNGTRASSSATSRSPSQPSAGAS